MDRLLLEKYFRGEKCSEEELRLIEAELDQSGVPDKFLFDQWKTAQGNVAREESDRMWEQIVKGSGMDEILPQISAGRGWFGRMRRGMQVAAIGVGILFLSVLLYRWYGAAGTEMVWKTVANPSRDIKYITLEDGTKVWLNAHSVLRYDEQYAHNGHREIVLEGEAFFDVAQDAARPFTVQTRGLKTRVLGTSFNIRAWPSLPDVEVALVSGRVQVNRMDARGIKNEGGAGLESVVLQPGQLLVYDNATAGMRVEEKGVRDDMVSWVKGKIVLDNTPLRDILRQLEQIYTVSIVADADIDENIRLTGQFRRDQIGDVLKNVLFPLDLTCSWAGGKYLIHKVKSK